LLNCNTTEERVVKKATTCIEIRIADLHLKIINRIQGKIANHYSPKTPLSFWAICTKLL